MNQAIKEARADASAMLGKYMRYPFAEGNYSLALGLVPMAEETWLDIDEHYTDEMREKARRLRDEYAMVFCALPGSERGQAEVLEMLLEHLAIYYPNFFRISRGARPRGADEGVEADARIENLINGETWRLGDFASSFRRPVICQSPTAGWAERQRAHRSTYQKATFGIVSTSC